MGKKRIPKSVIINVEIKITTQRIPDRLYQKLVEESERRNNIDFQMPELSGISLANTEPFSAKNERGLIDAEKYLLRRFRRALKRGPSRIIFQFKKIQRKEIKSYDT